MTPTSKVLRTVLALSSLLLVAQSGFSEDWPAYRGSDGDGISNEAGLAELWPVKGPKQLWRIPLGDGYSGVSIANGTAFTQFGRGKDEFALALDAATGAEQWRAHLGVNRPDSQGAGPRSTPTIDGDTVFLLSARGRLVALATDNGTERWSIDLVETFGAKLPRWGASTSPLAEDNLLIVEVGGKSGYSVVALDKRTGEIAWHSSQDVAGYSTPIAVDLHGERQIVVFSGSKLSGLRSDTGEVRWSFPWKTQYDVNAAMPVFLPPNRFFISSAYDKGAAVVEIRSNDNMLRPTEIWRSRTMRNHFNSSVSYDGHLYGFDNGTLKCVEAATGEETWAQRGFAKGSLLLADGLLIVLGERGEMALVEATPEAYRQRAEFRLFKDKTWTMPSLSDGRLFVRSQGELVALDLKNP